MGKSGIGGTAATRTAIVNAGRKKVKKSSLEKDRDRKVRAVYDHGDAGANNTRRIQDKRLKTRYVKGSKDQNYSRIHACVAVIFLAPQHPANREEVPKGCPWCRPL